MKLKQPLTDDQRTMVEDAIPLAKWCVQKYTSAMSISMV